MAELSQQAQVRLQQMRENYKRSLVDKQGEIERCWSACVISRWSEPHIADLKTQVHRLAGSADLYGFAELGAAAREMDICLPDTARAEFCSEDLFPLMAALESKFKEARL